MYQVTGGRQQNNLLTGVIGHKLDTFYSSNLTSGELTHKNHSIKALDDRGGSFKSAGRLGVLAEMRSG